jgi:hypothetical protein
LLLMPRVAVFEEADFLPFPFFIFLLTVSSVSGSWPYSS